jgi:transcriptional regulator with XRE-family HTH domain
VPKDFKLTLRPAPPADPDYLRQLRMLARLSQAEVAAQVGCSQSLVSQWEQGTKLPPKRILTYLNSIAAKAALTGVEEKRYPTAEAALRSFAEELHWSRPTSKPTETKSGRLRKLRAFLCHAKEDKDRVRALKRELLDFNVEPWLDEDSILAGQIWKDEIEKAIANTDAVIVCLSGLSTAKSGYVQKEINLALDAAELQPEGRIFIIPVRFEECRVPSRLSKIHYIDYFDLNGQKRLLAALSGLSGWINQNGNMVLRV